MSTEQMTADLKHDHQSVKYAKEDRVANKSPKVDINILIVLPINAIK